MSGDGGRERMIAQTINIQTNKCFELPEFSVSQKQLRKQKTTRTQKILN
jgi:hypothetical protein